jgi:hypothetical protein
MTPNFAAVAAELAACDRASATEATTQIQNTQYVDEVLHTAATNKMKVSYADNVQKKRFAKRTGWFGSRARRSQLRCLAACRRSKSVTNTPSMTHALGSRAIIV